MNLHQIETPFGTYARVAWTGGSSEPSGYDDPEYLALVEAYFREQQKEWLEFWGQERLPQDVEEIFLGRARGDAWATLRGAGRVD